MRERGRHRLDRRLVDLTLGGRRVLPAEAHRLVFEVGEVAPVSQLPLHLVALELPFHADERGARREREPAPRAVRRTLQRGRDAHAGEELGPGGEQGQRSRGRRGEAAKRIVDLAPAGMNKVFFTNGGAEANENAMKIARWITGRQKIIAFYRSYHGGTAGAISLATIFSVPMRGYRKKSAVTPSAPAPTAAASTIKSFDDRIMTPASLSFVAA